MDKQNDDVLDAPNSFGNATHFHIACASNAVTQVEGFLKAGINVNLESEWGFTPLHYAIQNNAMETFDLLIKHGADIRVANTHGDTPLHFALKSEALTLDFLDKIIRAGADVNAPNMYGVTPFECLVRKDPFSKEMVELFIRRSNHVNVYNCVTDEGLVGIAFNVLQDYHNFDKILRMFINSTDFLKVDTMNRNILHNLVSRIWDEKIEPQSEGYHVHFINKIVSLGCDLDATDSFGRTPVCTAILFGNFEGAASLLECGADINITDCKGSSAFDYSLAMKKYDLDWLMMTYMQMKIYAGLYCTQKDMQNFDNNYTSYKSDLALLDCKGMMHKLRHASIGSSITLHDFLSETGAVAAYPHMKQSDRKTVDDYFQNHKSELRTKYYRWSGLVLLQYRKARARAALMEPAMIALCYLTASCLDELCYDGIIRYLSNEDLKALIDV